MPAPNRQYITAVVTCSFLLVLETSKAPTGSSRAARIADETARCILCEGNESTQVDGERKYAVGLDKLVGRRH